MKLYALAEALSKRINGRADQSVVTESAVLRIAEALGHDPDLAFMFGVLIAEITQRRQMVAAGRRIES